MNRDGILTELKLRGVLRDVLRLVEAERSQIPTLNCFPLTVGSKKGGANINISQQKR